MTYWTIVKLKPGEDRTKPQIQVTLNNVFAAFHYKKAIKAEVPLMYAYGNAYWLTRMYFEGKLTGLSLNKEALIATLEGNKHKGIYRTHPDRLRKIGQVLCGPDAFWDSFIYPVGEHFYWGTLMGEMDLMFVKGASMSQVIKHDFNKCPLMVTLRQKEKKQQDKITEMMNARFKRSSK